MGGWVAQLDNHERPCNICRKVNVFIIRCTGCYFNVAFTVKTIIFIHYIQNNAHNLTVKICGRASATSAYWYNVLGKVIVDNTEIIADSLFHYTSRSMWYGIVLSGLILGLHPSNERRRYKVTLSLIGCAQTYNQPSLCRYYSYIYLSSQYQSNPDSTDVEIHSKSIYMYIYTICYQIYKGNVNYISHDDVVQWKHFPHYWPFKRGIHRSPVNSPHKSQWRGA